MIEASESKLRAIADALVAADVMAYELFNRKHMREFIAAAVKDGRSRNDAFVEYCSKHEDAVTDKYYGVGDGNDECHACQVAGEFWELHSDIAEDLSHDDIDRVMSMVEERLVDSDYRRTASILAMNAMYADELAATAAATAAAGEVH